MGHDVLRLYHEIVERAIAASASQIAAIETLLAPPRQNDIPNRK